MASNSEIDGLIFIWADERELQHQGTVVYQTDCIRIVDTGPLPMRNKPGAGQADQVQLRGHVGDKAAFVHGTPRIWDGETEILVHAIWIGTTDPSSRFMRVEATVDLADELLYYWCGTDGAARSLNRPLKLPALIDVPAMQLHYGDTPAGRVVIEAEEPLPIEHFEAHLDAFQRLLTLAGGRPTQRTAISLTRDGGGHAVEVFGRSERLAVPSKLPDPRTATSGCVAPTPRSSSTGGGQ